MQGEIVVARLVPETDVGDDIRAAAVYGGGLSLTVLQEQPEDGSASIELGGETLRFFAGLAWPKR
ncbi:MAG TPA: hypothetical protein VH414_15670 [Lichenihabitans sp.]|jgi:hypothetical protein|nr:hypothetical protein [Lichenihabitans sp.]